MAILLCPIGIRIDGAHCSRGQPCLVTGTNVSSEVLMAATSYTKGSRLGFCCLVCYRS